MEPLKALPPPDAPTDTEVDLITALMVELISASMSTLPPAYTIEPLMPALAAPRMWLVALARPPAKDTVRSPALSATEIAVATEEASISAVSLPSRVMSPPARSSCTPSTWAWRSLLIWLRAMLAPTATPVDLLPTATDNAEAATSARMVELSVAETSMSVPASTTLASSMNASVVVLNRFMVITAPTLIASESPTVARMALAALTIFASISASLITSTLIAPPATTSVFMMPARTEAGCSLPILVPIRASMVLNRKFCDCHPMLLKASVAPMDLPLDLVLDSMTASILDVLLASRSTSPPTWLRSLLRTSASAALSTTLVAMTPLMASEEPLPVMLPPSEVTTLLSLAVMVAVSTASTLTSPSASTTVLSM